MYLMYINKYPNSTAAQHNYASIFDYGILPSFIEIILTLLPSNDNCHLDDTIQNVLVHVKK